MKVLAGIIALLISTVCLSQDDKEKKLLSSLNDILRSTPHHHWAYEGMRMEIDTPFSIKDGILSMTVKYQTDASSFRVRMEAPVMHVHSTVVDIYLILYYKDQEVTYFEQVDSVWEKTFQSNLFHIGIPATSQVTDGFRTALATYLERKDLLPGSVYFKDHVVVEDEFNDGRKLVEYEGLFGFIDTSRMVIIPFVYEDAREFSGGFAAVKRDGSWGFVDREGNIAIPLKFSFVEDFENGNARVVWKNKWYVVDSKGKMKRLRRY